MVGGEGLTEGSHRGHGQWVTWARSARGVLHGLTGAHWDINGISRGGPGPGRSSPVKTIPLRCMK